MDFPVVKAHVGELSSTRIWQHEMCATFPASVNLYKLPSFSSKYTSIFVILYISESKKNHGSHNVLWVLTWVGKILVNFIARYRSG
jgi:hypothetical protein